MPNSSAIPNTTSVSPNAASVSVGQDSLVLAGFLLPVSILGTIGGIISFSLVAKKERKLRIPSDQLFLNLAGTAFLISAFSAPVQIFATLTSRPVVSPGFGLACKSAAFIYVFINNASPFSHACIALNRFFTVVLENTKFFQSKAIRIFLILLPWILALVLTIWPFFHVGSDYGFNTKTRRCATIPTANATVTGMSNSFSYLHFIRIFAPLTSLPVMLMCYSGIFLKVIIHRYIKRKTLFPLADKVAQIGEGNAKVIKSKRRRVMENHVTKVAVCSCAFFVVMYLPTTLFTLSTRSLAGLRSDIATYLIMPSWIGYTLSPFSVLFVDSHARTYLKKVWESGKTSAGNPGSTPSAQTVKKSRYTSPAAK